MEASDAALAERARGGDVEAFGELFRKTHRRLYNFVRQMALDPDEAEDLTQETYVRAWKGIKSLRSDATFLVWLHQIALNVVRDSRKRAVLSAVSLDSASEDEESLDTPDWSQEPERIALSEATREAVRRAIRSLPDIHRSVVTMHHLEGMEVSEIAEALGIAPGTVLSRLARAREALRRKLSTLVEQ